MKYLVLCMLFMFGCSNVKCPKFERTYKYGDQVKITSGFYEGHKGIITDTDGYPVIRYKGNTCQIAGYIVYTKLTRGELVSFKEIKMRQDWLIKTTD